MKGDVDNYNGSKRVEWTIRGIRIRINKPHPSTVSARPYLHLNVCTILPFLPGNGAHNSSCPSFLMQDTIKFVLLTEELSVIKNRKEDELCCGYRS